MNAQTPIMDSTTVASLVLSSRRKGISFQVGSREPNLEEGELPAIGHFRLVFDPPEGAPKTIWDGENTLATPVLFVDLDMAVLQAGTLYLFARWRSGPPDLLYGEIKS